MTHLNLLRSLARTCNIDSRYYLSHPCQIWENPAASETAIAGITKRIAETEIQKHALRIPVARGEELCQIAVIINDADNLAKELVAHHYENKPYISKCLDFAIAGSELDTRLHNVQDEIAKELKGFQQELRSWRRSPEKCAEIRAKADITFLEYEAFFVDRGKAAALVQERRIWIRERPQRIYLRLKNQRVAIERLEKDINTLFDRYYNIQKTTDPIEELKEIRNQTRDWWWPASIFNSPSVQGCKENEYHEGRARLRQLRGDIRYVLKHQDEVFGAGSAMLQDIGALTQAAAYFTGKKQEALTDEDKRRIVEIRKIPAKKHDAHRRVMYLDHFVGMYKEKLHNLAELVKGYDARIAGASNLSPVTKAPVRHIQQKKGDTDQEGRIIHIPDEEFSWQVKMRQLGYPDLTPMYQIQHTLLNFSRPVEERFSSLRELLGQLPPYSSENDREYMRGLRSVVVSWGKWSASKNGSTTTSKTLAETIDDINSYIGRSEDPAEAS